MFLYEKRVDSNFIKTENGLFSENIYNFKNIPIKEHYDKKRLILNGCNNVNAWGAGFVLAVDKYCLEAVNRKKAKMAYHNWYSNESETFGLGKIQSVPITDQTIIVNMITQNGTISFDNPMPTYDNIEKKYYMEDCLIKLSEQYIDQKDELIILAPKVGAGLGGGRWLQIRELFLKHLSKVGFVVFIIDPTVEKTTRYHYINR